jgi:hypothetical protein
MSYANLVDFSIALATSTLIGFFLTSILLPPRLSGGLTWILAVPAGIGLCSLIDFLFRRPMFTVETMVGLVLFALWLWRRGNPVRNLAAITPGPIPLVGLLFAVALVWTLVTSYGRVTATPFGGWDGWAIWNSHARMFDSDPKWKDHIEHTFHPDYPLLVPVMVVRTWRFVGGSVPGISGLISLVLTFSGFGALAIFLAERRSVLVSVLIGLVALSTPLYLVFGALQEADTPLAVFILCTIALVCLHSESTPDRLSVLTLAGFMAGCAGWTKNEGLLFIVAISIALLIPSLKRPRVTLRRFGAFSAGLAFPLAVIIFFKVTVAPQNDLLQNRHYEEIVGRISDVNRYSMISESYVHTMWTFGAWAWHPALPLLAVLLLSGIDWRALRSTGWLTGAGTVFIVLVGYYWVFVLTPLDLRYHLDTANFRLYFHVWPSVLLLAGLATVKVNSPEASPPG